jgi:tetratricopeptide (TPR) repeat protein
VAYLLFREVEKVPQATEGDEPAELVGKSAFLKGQYYFNHDEDPAPPYDTELAKRFYLQAIEAEPQNELARYQLGRIYFIEGNFDEAIMTFNIQKELFPYEVPNVDYMLGLTYGFRARSGEYPDDWEQAEDAFIRFIEQAPTSPYPRVDLAWVYFSQGKFEEMLEPLRVGLTHTPENAWLLNMYGLALLNTGNTDEALATFYKAREVAAKLTVEDWSRTYPGNDPELWGKGLEEFRRLIEKNIALAEKK